MQNRADVIVVGGGPAGLAAAIGFAKEGCETLVIEKQTWPINKACGEGILPHGVEELRSLGVLSTLKEKGCAFDGIEIISSNGKRAHAEFSLGRGLGISRTDLSQKLYDTARELPKLNFVKKSVTCVSQNENEVVVTTKEGQLRAHFIVAADGLRSTIRSQLAAHPKTQRRKRYGASIHFKAEPFSRFVEVYFTNGLEAYVTPCTKDRIGIAFLWYSDRFTPKHGRKEIIAECLAHFPELKEKIGNAEQVGPVQTTGPLHQRALLTVFDRVALIGDAAGYFDAITGEGISLSLTEARLLVERVVPFIKSGTKVPKGELKEFAKTQTKLRRWRYAKIQMTLWMARHGWLQKTVFAVFEKWPGLLRRFLS